MLTILAYVAAQADNGSSLPAFDAGALALQLVGAGFIATLAHYVAWRVFADNFAALLFSGPAFFAVIYMIREITGH